MFEVSLIWLAINLTRSVCVDGTGHWPWGHQEPLDAAEHSDEGAFLLCALTDPSHPWRGPPTGLQLLMTRTPGKDVICVKRLNKIWTKKIWYVFKTLKLMLNLYSKMCKFIFIYSFYKTTGILLKTCYGVYFSILQPKTTLSRTYKCVSQMVFFPWPRCHITGTQILATFFVHKNFLTKVMLAELLIHVYFQNLS